MLRWNSLILTVLAALILSSIAAEARTWTEAKTGRQLDAELVSVEGPNVILRRNQDGRRFTVALSALSEEDRAFISGWQARQASPSSARPTLNKGADRFDDLTWRSRDQIPVSGRSQPNFGALDDAILEFMLQKGIGAAVAAVSKNGTMLYDRAFGFKDARLKEPLSPEISMRLASITKPITAAAVKTAAKDGKLELGASIFDVLDLGKSAPKKIDPRWRLITINHLLAHQGGWDLEVSGDPMFMLAEIADDQRIELEELTLDDVITWMLARPLEFDPGSKEVYSNFGYNLLARAVEKASGKTFEGYLDATIAAEAKMTTLAISLTPVDERPPREIWYHFHPEYDRKPRTMPFRTEPSCGSGALACSAADLCRFLETYWISGELRKGEKYQYRFFGSMPGTTSVCGQRPDGVCYAVLSNRRGGPPADWNRELATVVDAALDKLARDG